MVARGTGPPPPSMISVPCGFYRDPGPALEKMQDPDPT